MVNETDIAQTIAQALGARIADRQFALLGNFATKAIRVTDSDEKGLVYIHGLGEDKASSYPAFNAVGIEELFGRPVEVERTRRGYKIIGKAPEDGVYMEGVEITSQQPVYREQLMFAAIAPNEPTDGQVWVRGGWVRVDDQHYFLGDVLSGDLTDGSTDDTGASAITLPSTEGQAKLVMIQRDPTDESVTYKQSSEFNAAFTHYQISQNGDVPIPDSGNILCGYVRLSKGISALTWDQVVNVPDVVYLSTASGSGGRLDVEGTGGETLSERDAVFQDLSADDWNQLDIDATAPVLSSGRIGFVQESGGIASAGTGTIRLRGVLGGFTGLTAGEVVWASTTAGGYTQTRPNITDGGGQRAIIELGFAISTTEIYIDPKPVIYARRETLSNNGTMTIEHHSDAQSRLRTVRAYVASTTTGTQLETYASSNQDSDVLLEGFTGSGDTIDIGTPASATGIGDYSGTERILAQSFTTVNGGQLSQIDIEFSSNIGSPSGDITWSVVADSSGDPDYGNAIDGGTFTPTPSATNTISSISGAFYDAATIYWLVLEAPAQATNSRYRVVADNLSSTYAGGHFEISTDGGSTWSPAGSGEDIDIIVTFSTVIEKDSLAQSFQLSSGETVGSVKLWLKKNGSPTGNLTLAIQTDSSSKPLGTAVTNGTSNTVAASTLSTSYGWIEFTFATAPSLSGSTTYWLVLTTADSQSDTNYVIWGADGSSPSYADGEMLVHHPTYSGDSIDTNITQDAYYALGDSSGNEYDRAQSFTTVNGGYITQFTFDLNANSGTPTGDLTWTLYDDNSTNPGNTLATGTITPTESATNTVNLSESVLLAPTTKYWIGLEAVAQSTNQRYNWDVDSGGSYGDGEMHYRVNGGAWNTSLNAADLALTVTLSAWGITGYDAVFDILGEGTDYDEPLDIGKVSAGGSSQHDIGVRFDDGAGADGDTKTTLKNELGTSADLVGEVMLP